MTDKHSEHTPMLAQYHFFKNQYPDCLLFFRLGDFYELFFEDASVGSKELNLVLTSRPAGKGRERIPMCGVPYHSANSYIAKLIRKGYKVAICEQVEDAAKAKGIVKREVIRVITPGTFFEKETDGIASLYPVGGNVFVGYINLGVGDFLGARVSRAELTDLLSKLSVKEVITPPGFRAEEPVKALGLFVTEGSEELYDETEEFKKHFSVFSLRGLGFESEDYLPALCSAFNYVKRTQKGFLPFLPKPKPYVNEGFVRIDLKARKGLELTESIEGNRSYSLLGVMDRTLTGMGRRRLRFRILNPFRDVNRIRLVQESARELVNNRVLREKIREILSSMSDLERLVSKVSSNMANPREILHLKNSLFMVEELRKVLGNANTTYLKSLTNKLEDTLPVAREIDRVLSDDPPLHVKEGGLIKEGVNSFLDELRAIRDNSKRIIKDYERKLREETGILSLKVGYNKVMGFYIEVTKPNLRYVPPYFRRRQTLSNSERFTTDELQALEEKVLSSQSRINDIEYELFTQLRGFIVENIEKVGRNASVVAEVDYLQSLAQIAYEKGWNRPEVHEGFEISIKDGRHPVIEEFNESFVPNSTYLTESSPFHIITGPNMAGKSSYIRQVAVLTLMAHMGSFIPCDEARVGSVDAIFVRVGSGDILAMGVSTFMNEMLEVASILNNASERSLIILDEIGRGTSTYDGIAITRAIAEYILKKVKAKTLLATHFLEITELEEEERGVKNFHMSVSRDRDEITFLYSLKEGKAQGSFGIDVAKMAGLPKDIVNRSREILSFMEDRHLPILEEAYRKSEEVMDSQIREVLREILSIDIASITPLQALIKLNEIKERLRDKVREFEE